MRNTFVSICIGLVACSACGQVPTSWSSVGVGGGGAFFAPRFSPLNTTDLSVGTDMTGFYRSTTGGQKWTLDPFTTIQSGRYSPKLQYTSSALVQYSIDFTSDLMRPVVTTNGGLTWSSLPYDPTGNGAWNIIADPASTTRLLVSDYTHVYYSADGGKSWTLAAINSNGLLLACAQWIGNTIVFVTNQGTVQSTDSGKTFRNLILGGIPSTEQIASAACTTAGNTTRFIAVTVGAGQSYPGIQGDDHNNYRGVYTFDYGSTSWRKIVTGIPSAAHPFYVAMSRNSVSTAYLAGGSSTGNPVVLKTTNGGSTWASVFNSTNNSGITTGWCGYLGDRDWSYAELAFGLDVHATDANRVAFTDYGFIHQSTDGGTTWKQSYVSTTSQNTAGVATPKGKSYLGIGLENTTAWSIGWSDSSTVWGAFSDIRGIRSTDGGSTWGFNYSGHTANSSYETATIGTNLYLATSSVHDLYQSTRLTDATIDSGVGDVLTSADKGKTWTKLGSLGKPVISLSADPTNTKRLYAAVVSSTVGGVYVCQDVTKGTTAVWTKLTSPPRTEGHANVVRVLNDGTLLATFSGRRTSNFTASSGLFKSSDGGKTWTDLSIASFKYWTKDVVIDPTDATQNTWYVAVFSGWGGSANNLGGLYKTTNRGANWTKVFSSDRVDSCTVNPKNGNEVYATTETQGLWRTANAKATVPSFALVSGYLFRHPVRVFFNPYKAELWVTSFGNGISIGR